MAETKLYTNEIRRVLEYQEGGPGTRRLFKVERIRFKDGWRWGIPVFENAAVTLAAQIAARLMAGGFTLEQVLLFSQSLQFYPSDIYPALCWPDYPDTPEVE